MMSVPVVVGARWNRLLPMFALAGCFPYANTMTARIPDHDEVILGAGAGVVPLESPPGGQVRPYAPRPTSFTAGWRSGLGPAVLDTRAIVGLINGLEVGGRLGTRAGPVHLALGAHTGAAVALYRKAPQFWVQSVAIATFDTSDAFGITLGGGIGILEESPRGEVFLGVDFDNMGIGDHGQLFATGYLHGPDPRPGLIVTYSVIFDLRRGAGRLSE